MCSRNEEHLYSAKYSISYKRKLINYSELSSASQTQSASFKSVGFSQISGLVIAQTSLLTKVGCLPSNSTQYVQTLVYCYVKIKNMLVSDYKCKVYCTDVNSFCSHSYFKTDFYVLRSSSIWMCPILNICFSTTHSCSIQLQIFDKFKAMTCQGHYRVAQCKKTNLKS